LNGRGSILQPGPNLDGMGLSLYGEYPVEWLPHQHVRSDDDPPSRVLPAMLALGASAMNPMVAPPSRGCVLYGYCPWLICGDGLAADFDMRYHADEIRGLVTLMRVCKTVYSDTLGLLYGANTISLFGTEMVPFFARNASPDGLRCIRYVHLVLRLDAARWNSAKRTKEVSEAIECLERSFPALQQLDVEVVVTWGQPLEPSKLWDWVMQDVFSGLKGLESFVLKISVLEKLVTPMVARYGWEGREPAQGPLSTWNGDDYKILKERIAKVRS
jgi:hypothetical protein